MSDLAGIKFSIITTFLSQSNGGVHGVRIAGKGKSTSPKERKGISGQDQSVRFMDRPADVCQVSLIILIIVTLGLG